MDAIRIQGGHKFRLKHGPDTSTGSLKDPTEVAMSARGFRGLKAKVVVKEGDVVKLGQPLFIDKANNDVKFTSPAAGTVKEVRYGDRRKLKSIVVEVSGDDAIDFGKSAKSAIESLDADTIVSRLTTSGVWTQLRTFPGRAIPPVPGWMPEPDAHGHVHKPPTIRAVYVSALATEPHLASPLVALGSDVEMFAAGLEVLKKLSAKTWIFTRAGERLPEGAVPAGVQQRSIVDKYPAENTGLQVYYTERLKKGEVALSVGVETVLDVGHLFLHGKVRTERTYAVAGAAAKERKHFKGRVGVSVKDVTGALPDDTRVIAGGLFSGEKLDGDAFLSATETSLHVMTEDRERVPFNFQRLGLNRFTMFRAYVSGLFPNAEREATTSNNGEERACVQCSMCIDVCPVDLMPVLLMKAVDASDIENMEKLSIHDCVDCGLCSFVCPSKIEIAQSLDDGKSLIAKEG